jgi:hypothetical protein
MRIIPLHIGWTFLLLHGFYSAQSQGAARFKASVDHQQILIGEPIRLELEAQVPLGTDSAWTPVDSLAHFEFIDRGKIDTQISDQGKTFRQTIVLTSFDSGGWTIPAMVLSLGGQIYLTDSIPIQVSYSKYDPSQDYRDIKDILAVENPYTRYIAWTLGLLTLGSLLALLYLLTRKSKQAPAVARSVPSLSPYDEAVRALEELKKTRLWENGRVKLFYTELNDIFRRFIERRLAMSSMERTNEELILTLRNMKWPDDEYFRLVSTLRMSDFVKFAKYLPQAEDNLQDFDVIRTSIDTLNTQER